MTRLRSLAAVGALAAAAAAAGLSVREVSVSGHRGARRLTAGFVSGRWDARFLVARGPAAVLLPAVPLRATVLLSGPAVVRATTEAGAVTRAVGETVEPWTFDLRNGGRVDLQADGAVRLHGVRLVRLGPPSPAFAALVARASWDRVQPGVVLGGLLLAMALAAMTGRRTPSAPAPPAIVPAVAALIVLVSCLAQVLFWPQPLVIGDPGAYHDMAGRFRDVLRSPLSIGDALHELRPYAALAFTATVYGALRALRDAPSTIYVAQALAMGGAVFFLVRAAERAFGRPVAALTGILSATYAVFPILCGTLQPEPFILLAWCFAFHRLVAAGDDDPRRLVPAGLAFGLGLALHPQGIWFLLAAALLLLAPFAATLRRASVRRRALAFALGLLPVALATSVGEAYARPAVHVLEERYGFFAYTVPHPLGFWLFLESDGWQSAVRLDQTRYGRHFADAREKGELASGTEAWAFTLRFAASDAKASLRAVLRNLHRLYRRPDNPFHRTWLIPYGLQVPQHQALVIGFLLAIPLLLAARAWPAVLPVAMLASTYPLYHVFNKYAVPATPFVLLGAAVSLRRLAAARAVAPWAGLLCAALGAWLPPASLALAGAAPPVARWGLVALQVGGLVTAFAWSARQASGLVPRAGAGVAALACLLALGGSRWDDPGWRAFRTTAAAAPRQEILLDSEALAVVRSARESYVALDLALDDGDPSDLRLEFDGGLQVPGAALRPTMPTFGLATTRGGRDPRRFPQWWILPWQPEMSPGGRLAVTVRGDEGSRLGGDIGGDPPGSHHGVSLGHWPHISVYRLMHEGEYRLPVHQPVDPSRRRSANARQATIPGTYGIRLVALDDDAGGAEWSTAPAAPGEVVTAVWARAGRSAAAVLVAPAGAVSFELGGVGPWVGAGGELRYRPTGEYEGWYLLRTVAPSAGAQRLTVLPRHGMSAVRKYFLPERRDDSPPIPAEWSSLPFTPAAEIAFAREAPSWKPVGVY